MPRRPSPEVTRVARKVARRLVKEGAVAVTLVGSRVRGDFYAESDIDIRVIGRKNLYRLDRVGGFLVSIAWKTEGATWRELRSPAQAGGAVPAWRLAVILHDPKGVAKALKRAARDWTWGALGKRREAWVAEEFTGWAEEVHRLVGNQELGRSWAAAIQRSILALRLAPILAVHHRILYDTENNLWDLVGEKMGVRWSRAQSAALGMGGERFKESCDAALRLYAIAAEELRDSLDDRQRAIVEHACEIARRAMSGP
jgi:hypothetical protein